MMENRMPGFGKCLSKLWSMQIDCRWLAGWLLHKRCIIEIMHTQMIFDSLDILDAKLLTDFHIFNGYMQSSS